MLQKICSRCGKERPIVVYVNRINQGKAEGVDGYCLRCAREMKIEPIASQLDRMGLSDEDIEELEGQMQGMFGGEGVEDADDEGTSRSFDFSRMLSGLIPTGEGPTEGALAKNEPSPKQERARAREQKKEDKERKHLRQFCLDLTARARAGELDRIVGREAELARVIQILCRRTKSNPALIGEPGVGKTAVVEALAQKIADGTVPHRLRNKEIFVLDMTALVAGTQFRGQFENRIRALIEEVRRLGNIILMIDEIHTLVSAGDAEGGMNAANILKPALSRGEIQVIGATTLSEYRKHIEKDAALERRFQSVMIDEPSEQDTVLILKGVAEYYEAFHRIRIPEPVLVDAVRLSERYITDRFLPDKAIDLIDEAAARASLDSALLERLAALTEERATQNRLLEEAEAVSEKTDETYAQIAHAKTALAASEEEWQTLNAEKDTVVLTREDLAHVIEIWTGIPAASVSESEWEKIDRLQGALSARVKGQDEAIDSLCRAIRRSRTGISPKKKPASFLFAGPTGVGKTELVKQLSIALFESEESLIRLDMSEFMEKHSVSRIIGSPPGYVGYDDAGQLTEKIRRKPYSVILFDEIEKAHPDVLSILLQVLDDGRISDAHGKVVNFENTLIVMTTNAGSTKSAVAGFASSRTAADHERTMRALEGFLRPEFINRIDEIITFRPLGRAEFSAIARLQLGDLAASLALKGITLRYDDAVCETVATESYSEKFGARGLRRYLQTEVEDAIASLLIEHFRTPPTAITLVSDNGRIRAVPGVATA